MIPKKIHYCWFGGKPKSALALKCIKSWETNCKDYEIIEWNEKNFDLHSNRYVWEAYQEKKWAFVSDYVRLYVLYQYGGVYLDTDVEVIKPFDFFRNEKAFIGFESHSRVQTGVIASESHQQFIGRLLKIYDHKRFIQDDKSLDLTANVELVTNEFLKSGLVLNGKKQVIEGITVYPTEFFCPKDFKTRKLRITENTYMIHHFDGSWIPADKKIKSRIAVLIGPRTTNLLIYVKRKISKLRKRK